MIVLVFCNCPTEEAEPIARTLIEEQLAACVNILPAGKSVYRWEGEVCVETESTLLIKTSEAGYPALESRLLELHSYDVPEVIAIDPKSVNSPYARWVLTEVK